MRRIGVIAGVFVLVLSLLPVGAQAEGASKTALSISPLRKNTAMDAGTTKDDALTVANLTDKPIKVKLQVKEFSVTDYRYDYTFSQPANDWIKLGGSAVELAPNERKKVWYKIDVPDKAAPGGYYYTLFASTDVANKGLPSTLQTTTQVYLTVKGDLVRTSVLKNDSIPWFVMGPDIVYKFDVEDTGNVHFSAYFYGQLRGLVGEPVETGASHMLLPGAVRTVEGLIPSPILPGIYHVEYGYKVDFANIVTAKSTYILYAPPWSIALLVFLLLSGKWLYDRKLSRSSY